MDLDLEDDDQGFLLTRSNSWSHSQRPVFMDKQRLQQADRANYLSCIFETDDTTQMNAEEMKPDLHRNRSKSISGPTGLQAQVKKRRHSYTELIASAILSSAEKRKTLAEIYDWFVLNVPSFKDQRYMHSSLGWKNAVRHNLSVQTCFKRVKRHGMEKPSWWTVDMGEVAKRRLVLRPTLSCSMSGSTGDITDGPFLPPRRNTYSGPNPTGLSQTAGKTDGGQTMNYKIDSSMIAPNVDGLFSNTNFKRTRFAPIRPAVSGHLEGTNHSTIGSGNEQVAPMGKEQTFSEAMGLAINNQPIEGDFLKPCAMEAYSLRSHTAHSPTVVPSVTLVCKEESVTPTRPYQNAQLELSLLQTDDDYTCVPTTSSPSAQPYTHFGQSITGHSQLSPTSTGQPAPQLPNGFPSWPSNLDQLTQLSGNDGVSPISQTLRVKMLWGNVQDITVNGLLPMRTVVKRDGCTQTDQGTCGSNNNNVSLNKAAFTTSPWETTDFNVNHSIYDSGFASDLPEDLAGLQIEGDLHCDISEVMHASLEPQVTKPAIWSWESSLEPIGYSNFNDLNAGYVQRHFNCAKTTGGSEP